MLSDANVTYSDAWDDGFIDTNFDEPAADYGSDLTQTKQSNLFSTSRNDYNYDADSDYENEPPLLEELGINFEFILQKTSYVLIPRWKELDVEVLADGDITGPLVFMTVFGCCLLLTGRVHFGYLFGFGTLGASAINILLNLMSEINIDLTVTLSVLGYSVLPVVLLSAVKIIFSLKDVVGFIIATCCVLWSSAIATSFIEKVAQMRHQRYLVAYPLLLFYSMFAIITIY